MDWVAEISAIRAELIASGITAVMIFFGQKGIIRFKNYHLNKKHQLSGDYITYYRDKVDRKKVMRKATLKIDQSGNTFLAHNKNLDDDREWELRGDILPNGYLAGNYGHLNPDDSSKGTFFLEADITDKGNYRGHWTGYDSVNREIASGEYIWRKINRCKIRTLTAKDKKHIDQISGVFSESLGFRFIKRNTIEEALINKGDSGLFLQAAFANDRIVGVRTLRILSETEKDDYQAKVRRFGGSCSLELHKTGMLASNAVMRGWRRRGIGSQLVESGLDFLKKKGCTACVADSWQSGETDSSASVLKAIGFRKLTTAHDYWKEESISEDYECPKCGSPPCECSASFYMKEL